MNVFGKRESINYKKLFLFIFLFSILYASGLLGGYMFFNNKVQAVMAENIKIEEEVNKSYEEGNKILFGDKNKKEETIHWEKDIKKYRKADSKSVAFKVEEAFREDNEKIAFLTFDDGPSRTVTPKILEILSKEDIKATFFVIGSMSEENKDILKDIYDSGHSIGNHSYSHEFSRVYASEESFIAEVEKAKVLLKDILGEDFNSRLFRFPGGSFERSKDKYKEIIKEKGMVYIDWNALNGDAEGNNISAERLINRVKNTVENQNHVVILMHDAPAKQTTVEALPATIEYLKSQGYKFRALK